MLVQSVLVQEQGLEAANARVQELEEHLRSLEEGDRPRSGRSRWKAWTVPLMRARTVTSAPSTGCSTSVVTARSP